MGKLTHTPNYTLTIYTRAPPYAHLETHTNTHTNIHTIAHTTTQVFAHTNYTHNLFKTYLSLLGLWLAWYTSQRAGLKGLTDMLDNG